MWYCLSAPNDVGSEIKKIVAGFHNKMCACEMGGKKCTDRS